MIFLKNITLNLGGRLIFDDINLSLNQNQRIGIIGRNGAGKSTLLKLISGLIQFDSGDIEIQKNKKIAYLPQEFLFSSQKDVFEEAFSIFHYYTDISKRKLELENILKNQNNHTINKKSEDYLEEYLKLIEELEKFDNNLAIQKTKAILNNLGFKDKDFIKKVSELSEGWKMRLLLAKLLLQEADFYLFDEPTNHLDISTKVWFEHFLKNSNFGFLLVTHDRYFLDNCCDYILEIERGQTKIFTGNYEKYLNIKEHQKEIIENSYKRQQKEIAQKEEFIEKFRYKATKAKMVQSMIKKLEKLDIIEIDPPLPAIKLNFSIVEQSGKVVLTFKNLEKSFNNKLIFHKISGEIQRGDKIAIVAPNGAGKTTLINILTNKYNSDNKNSSIHFGHNVKLAIFEQDQLKALNLNNTVYQEIIESCSSDISESQIRGTLGAFLFTQNEIKKKVSVLSGGERNRLAMVKILLSKSNFLILDEPTNHLDLYSKEILLQALKQYNGTILFVSHDQDFLNKLANKIFILNENEIYIYHGNYKSYLESNLEQNLAKNFNIKNNINKIDQEDNQQKTQYRKELKFIENKIAKLEQEITKINNDFANIKYESEDYQKNIKLLKEKENKLNDYNNQWEKLIEKL